MAATNVLKMSPNEPVAVYLPRPVMRQLKAYIAVSPEEVSGLGDVLVQGDGLLVSDIFLLEQESSAAHTTLLPRGTNQLASERLQRNGDIATLKLWWHSHGALPVYWSGTDEAAIAGLAHSGWWLSIVGNHASEYLARLDMFPTEQFPFRMTIPAILEEVDQLSPAELAKARREVQQKVKPPQPIAKRRSKKGGGRGLSSPARSDRSR